MNGAAQYGAVHLTSCNEGGLFSMLRSDRSIAPTKSSVLWSGDSPWWIVRLVRRVV